MKMAMNDYPGFYEKMSRLRVMEIGLDGAICAGGGQVRVHLPYMAACNQTLFDRITVLMKQGKTELKAHNMSLEGIQLIVDFCYSGELDITEDNFKHIIDAALGLEFLNIVEKCIQFALPSNLNANIWSHFLRAAFKHPRSVQSNSFVPDLILHNIRKIPKEAIIKGLDGAYISELLEHGTVDSKDRCYAINIFLEMMLSDKSEIKTYTGTIRRMKDLVRPGDKLIIPNDSPVTSTMSLMELSLEIDFPSLVKGCVNTFETTAPSAAIVSRVLMWMKQYSETESGAYLNRIISIALRNLPMDISEDDICCLLQNVCLGTTSEFDLFKIALKWIEHNNANVNTKRKIIALIRFGLMRKEEIDEVISDFHVESCGEIFYSAMRYHIRKYDQPLAVGDMNKMRKRSALVYVMGGKDGGDNHVKNVHFSEASTKPGNITLSPFTEACQTPFELYASATTEMNGFIFVSGGRQVASDAVNTCFRFDPRTSTWMELAPMTQSRFSHTLISMGDSMIAVGGRDKEDDLVSVERYDVKNNRWTVIEPLPKGRGQHSASCVDGVLYISGGSHSKTLFNYFDEVWNEISPMLQIRQGHAMTGVNDMLFVAGGAVHGKGTWSDVMSSESYDIMQNQWTELCPPRFACNMGCSGRVGNWFIILGGFSQDKQTKLDMIQAYDIASNRWELCDIKLPNELYQMVGNCVSGQ